MTDSIQGSSALIIGGSSFIGQAIIKLLLLEPNQQVISVSQQPVTDEALKANPRIKHFVCDYSESEVNVLVNDINQLPEPITQVFICNGVLHGEFGKPEKKLQDIDIHALETVFRANAIVPLTWLTQLERLPLANHADIVIFSARIGSTGDNQLGGWYSYRASKSALNMLVKTAAIELKRKFKQWCFVLYHPGTIDTPLSKPFQKNIPPEKLFTPDFTAQQLLSLIPTLSRKQVVHYVDWQGLQIEW